MSIFDRRGLAAALAVAGLALASCASAVKMPEPSPPPEVVRLCRALHHALPDRLAGKERRATEPDSRLLAAWGSPPVALRCGVGRPGRLRPTSRLVTVNGLDWLPGSTEAPTRFTTVGREAYIQVILPEGLPAANVLVELAAPIKTTIPSSS